MAMVMIRIIIQNGHGNELIMIRIIIQNGHGNDQNNYSDMSIDLYIYL